MEEKKDICAAITEDAENYAAEAIKAAEEYAETKVKEAEFEAQTFALSQGELAKKDSADVAAKNAAAERMEKKKIMLAAKVELIEGVYKRLLGRLESMSESDLAVFVEKLIEKYAEEGDEIVISENSVLGAEKVSEMPVIKKLGLKVSGGGKFSGGFVIKSATFDRDLSFSAIVGSIKEQTEAEVSAKLFG